MKTMSRKPKIGDVLVYQGDGYTTDIWKRGLIVEIITIREHDSYYDVTGKFLNNKVTKHTSGSNIFRKATLTFYQKKQLKLKLPG